MNIYLAGPMRGKHLYNLVQFAKASRLLRDCGHRVFNPIEVDMAEGELDPSMKLEDQEFDLDKAMRRDLQYIVSDECDALFLLPGWQDSKGCQVEILAAANAGKKIYLFNADISETFVAEVDRYDVEIKVQVTG